MTTQVQVNVPILEYDDILSSMHVKLYVGADVLEYVFTKSGSSPSFEIELPEGEPLQYDYQYEAFFGEGGSMLSGRHQATSKELVIHPSRLDLGVLDAYVLCPPMEFRSITVSVEVAGQRQDLVFVVPCYYDESRNERARFVVGNPIGRDYRYKTRYELMSGRVVETDWCDSRAIPLVVPNLFHEQRRFLFVAAPGREGLAPVFRLSVKHSDAYNVEEDFPISLGAEDLERKLEFGVIDPTNARFSYKGFVLMPDGTTQSIPETELTSSVVLLQARNPD